jgi:integrase
MASIQKIERNKGYAYKVQIRRKGFSSISRIFESKELALNFAKSVENDREKMLAFGEVRNQIKLDKLVDDYFYRGYQGKRPKEQRWKINYWINHIGNKNIGDINRYDILSGINNLPSHYKNSTINRFKAAISALLTFAVNEYDLKDNPARLVKSKPENNQRTRYLSEDERKRLLKESMSSNWDKFYLLILLALTTGARRSEITNLKWSDIDFINKTATVNQTKNGEPRVLPLTNSVINEMQSFNQDFELIFHSPKTPDKPYDFRKQWVKLLKKADINDFTFHCIRHSTASYLAQQGVSLIEISSILGHKQIQVTMRYSHLAISNKQRLIEKYFGEI